MSYVENATNAILAIQDEIQEIGNEISLTLFPALKKAIAAEDHRTIDEINARAQVLRAMSLEKQAKAQSLEAILKAMGHI